MISLVWSSIRGSAGRGEKGEVFGHEGIGRRTGGHGSLRSGTLCLRRKRRRQLRHGTDLRSKQGRHDHRLERLHSRRARDRCLRQRDRRLREAPSQRPCEERRRGQRRQDRRRDPRGQRPQRGALVLVRQHRGVLQLRRVDRPAALHRPRQRRHQPVPGGGPRVHGVQRDALRDAAAGRRLRPLLQQGPARAGWHHLAAEDLLGARRGREEADAALGRRSTWPGSTHRSASTRTRRPITRRPGMPSGSTGTSRAGDIPTGPRS